MAWILLVLVLWASAAAVAAACGVAVAWNHLAKKYRRQLESAEATWQLRHQQDSPGTVIESVSSGWLNLLLQTLWTPVLEKHVAGLTTELLQKVFLEVLAKGANKTPWKYLDSIEVEEISFGLVPPTFQTFQAKFDPTAAMLTLSTDVRFVTSSAQAVLLVRSKAVGLFSPVAVRLEVTHVKLRGRLRLGLVLGQESPGIQGIYYSFVSPPHLDVAVRPLGLPLPSVVPGVDTALRGVLTKLISRRMVEPQRRYLDIHRIYLNKHIARVGGPGGLLRLVVLGAANLGTPQQQQQQSAVVEGAAAGSAAADSLSSRGKGSSKSLGGSSGASNAAAAKQLSSYCEVKFGRSAVVLRTPIVHHSVAADCSWHWQFSLALPHELSAWPAAAAVPAAVSAGGGSSSSPAVQPWRSSGGGSSSDGSDELSVVVYDAQTVGQAVPLGRAKVSLCGLQLQPNGAARTLTLPLQKASSSRATVQLSVQWLKSTKQPSSQQQQQARKMQTSGQRAPAQQAQQAQQLAAAQAPWNSGTPAQRKAAAAAASAGGAGSPPPSKPPVPRSVSAFVPSSKGVSWQDKTQLRVQSAATAAKNSFRQLVSSSSSAPDSDKSQQEGAAAGDPDAGAAGDVLGPWGAPPAAAAAAMPSSDASTAAASAAGSSPSPAPRRQLAAAAAARPAARPAALQVDPATDSESPSPSGRSLGAPTPTSSRPIKPTSTAGAAAAPGAGSSGRVELGADMRSSSSKGWLAAYGLSGLGAWLWPDDSSCSSLGPSAGYPAAAAGSGGGARDAGTGRCSPWASSPGQEDSDDQQDAADGGESEGFFSPSGGAGGAGSTPLALLSHVVHMQKEVEQQRAQLEALQQQLDHTSNSYQRLKQVCRQRGRAALLQGARFLLHKADGSTQHILLYLTHAGSSRGVQPSRLGRLSQQPPQQQQQQQRGDAGMELVIAALPETRREARLAFKRLAAAGAAADVGAPAGASAGGGVTAAAAADGSSSHPAGSSGPASASSGGGSGSSAAATAASNPARLSGFGSVGARLRLRLQRGTLLQLGYESGKFPRSVLQVLKVVPAAQLVGVVRGSANGSSSVPGVESFTLLVQEQGGASSSGHVTAINLQLPPTGNARCLDEWLLALRDVAVARASSAAAAEPQQHVHSGGGVATADGRAGASMAAAASAGGGGAAADGWLLPAAAAATPQPWPAAGAEAAEADSDDDDDDDDDTDSTATDD